ncbi:MAG: hypothetical protein AB9866_25705 [Syntrophobacteraceae bacterium]
MDMTINSENSSHHESSAKLLSICMSGRNDDYGGNFRYRIQTALNHFARNAQKLGLLDIIEIVVTDWNSDTRLGEALSLNSATRALTRFISVPPHIAAALNPGNTLFNNSLSMNTAIRRASGEFVMAMASDILLSQASLKNLIELLQGKLSVPVDVARSLMLIHRKFVPWQLSESEPDIDTIDDFLFHNSWKFRIEVFDSGLNSGMGACLMHRRLFEECRGIDEKLSKWGWSDIELGLRINQRYPTAVLSHLGIYCYELDIRKENRLQTIQERNPQIVGKSFESNSADWGLGFRDLEIYAAPVSYTPKNQEKQLMNKTELLRDMRDTHVRPSIVQCFGEDILKSPVWPAVFMLAYCASAFKPRSFVDFSFVRGSGSAVVPFLCPCITVAAIDALDTPSSANSLVGMITFLQRASYQGRLHVLSGETESAFKRLVESVRLYPLYDLVHFVPALFPETWLSQLEHILQYTSPTGAIVVSASRPGILREIDTYINSSQKRCLFVKSYTKGTGIIIKDGLPQGSETRNAGFDENTEEIYMNSILGNHV